MSILNSCSSQAAGAIARREAPEKAASNRHEDDDLRSSGSSWKAHSQLMVARTGYSATCGPTTRQGLAKNWRGSR